MLVGAVFESSHLSAPHVSIVVRCLNALTDEQLLAISPRRSEAFGAFYRRHVDAVLGYFLGRTHDPELAADLMAETFAAALLALDRYTAEQAPPRAWLFTIARHKLIDSYRSGAVRTNARMELGLAPLELEDPDIERILECAALPDVLPLLAELPPEQRDAVTAHVLDEEAYRDIALRLDCSEAVIRKRVSRGLHGLKTRLERYT